MVLYSRSSCVHHWQSDIIIAFRSVVFIRAFHTLFTAPVMLGDA